MHKSFKQIWQCSVASKETGLEANVDKTKYMLILKSGNAYYHLVYLFAIQKYKNYDTEKYDFACCIVLVWNMFTHNEGGREAEDVWEQGAEENTGAKRDEETWEWRKLHNEEFNDLYSPNNVQVIKSWRMRWAGHVACMGEVYTVIWLRKMGEKDHLEDPD